MAKEVRQEIAWLVLPKWRLPGEGERYLDGVEGHDGLNRDERLDGFHR